MLTAAFQKGYTWLVILGAINTAISVFYYLKLVRAAYSPEESGEAASASSDRVEQSMFGNALAVFFSGAILIIGSLPDLFLNIFRNAIYWVS